MKPMVPIVPGIDLPVTIIAKDQPQYRPLPAYITGDGEVITRWQLNWKERLKILLIGDLYIRIWTFRKPLQPVLVSVNPPEFEEE